MIPSWYHTGTPRYFHFSTTSGSACLTIFRIRARVSPRQSPSSSIRVLIRAAGDFPPFPSFEPAVALVALAVFFFALVLLFVGLLFPMVMVSVAFVMVVVARVTVNGTGGAHANVTSSIIRRPLRVR